MRQLAAAVLLAIAFTVSVHADAALHRYWPRFPRPKAIITVPFVGDHEEGMTFETAAGLAALAVREGKSDLMLYERLDGNPAYMKWGEMMLAQVKPKRLGTMDTWAAVAELKKRGIVRGYILYRYDTNKRGWHDLGKIDESANVATALASVLGGVAVGEKFQAQAEKLGLPRLLDARDKTEQWCLGTYGPQFTRKALMTADPKSRVARSMGVALRTFVVSQPGPVYQAALARCEPDCPIVGWGCGGEDTQTMGGTEWGLFQTATNWCHDLPVFDTEEAGETIPAASVRSPRAGLSALDLNWETGVHYATFLMTDGDNVQWLMGNFTRGPEGPSFYDSPARGQFPFGWTICPVDLMQVCPYTLQDVFQRATPEDDFVLMSGGGYYYPEKFGVKRNSDVLSLHMGRVGEYMRLAGIRTVAYNLQDWDGPEAVSAYGRIAASVPTLDAIYAFQYYPYSGGEGRILWARRGGQDIPVISCALCIWAQTGRPRDTTPAGVAHWLNGMPTGGQTWSESDFSFVMAHCWSRFRDTHGDPSLTAEEQGVDQVNATPDTPRGLLPVKWCVDRLQSQVRVVTPGQMALLVRLHLRTRQVLGELTDDLARQAQAANSASAQRLVEQARALLPTVRDGDESGRECFEMLKRARGRVAGK